MEITTIDAPALAKMFLAAAKKLEAHKDEINELNVFPVPDGDTGTNMTMTIMSAAKAVDELQEIEMRTVCKAISSGSLRGARGNSGVILSQLFRGFTKVIKREETLDVQLVCAGFQRSVETAYKAVMQPKEGTILTVARAGADKALEMAEETDDLLEFMEAVVREMEDTLKRTPEMLPVLKEAGVVDSGGQGLLMVLTGALEQLSGKEIDLSLEPAVPEEEKESRFSYKMEFSMVPHANNSHADRKELRSYMNALGDGMSLARSGDVYRGTLCTDDPGRIITKVLRNGILSEITIEHIGEISEASPGKWAPQDQDEKGKSGGLFKKKEKEDKPKEKKFTKDMGIVAVSIGKGMTRIFKELGADTVIQGGQTMNPSTEDIVKAIEAVPAKTVFVLPNNKNIILSANQATELVKDQKVVVLPTRTLPQGITALINFIPDQSVEENEERMKEEISNVKSGEITRAVRDTVIKGRKIRKNDFMAIGDSGILASEHSIEEAFSNMIEQMVDEDSALISIYFGKDVRRKAASRLADKVEEMYPDLEIELQDGGQPVYYYVISVE